MRKLPEIPTKFAFEDLRGPMFHMAIKFCRRFPQFEKDELVNEFWLSRRVRAMKDIKMVWQACKWAFWDYYRKQTGWNHNTGKLSQKRQGCTISFEDIGIEEIDYEIEYYEPGYDDVDAEDFREVLWSKLNERERAVCEERRHGKTQKETGQQVGLSKVSIGQIERKIERRYVRPMLVA